MIDVKNEKIYTIILTLSIRQKQKRKEKGI